MLNNYTRTFFAGLSICSLLTASCKKEETTSRELTAIVPATTDAAVTTDSPTFLNYLGVNGFDWDFLQNPADPNNGAQIYEPKMQLIESFAAVRHYLDWQRVETVQGQYTFNPSHNGNWNFDAIYQRCKADNISMLVCFKNCPSWLQQTYPSSEQNVKDVPMPYGSDKSQPQSYILQAKAAFQFAARYGSNAQVDKSLVNVYTASRWTGDPANEVKIGLNTVSYIECNNEPDNWWIGSQANQSADEYAANLSAFYDGHKGTLGKDVGVKTADPNMKVVMAGLASADPNYVKEIINWCKINRGYKSDGSINLCFDVINYHLYNNDHASNSNGNATVGVAPELTSAAQTAASFVSLAKTYNIPVWVTETGYDLNSQSTQRAISIGNKSNLVTQADWLLRSSLLYARNGVKRLFFYELYDDNAASSTQYESSGLLTSDLKRRPAANYMAQVKALLGKYSYRKTLSQRPIVDEYQNGITTIYCLVSPTQTGKTQNFVLPLTTASQVIVHTLNPNATTTIDSKLNVVNNKVTIPVSETPVFVELEVK